MKKNRICIILLLSVFLTSCSTTKFVGDGDFLYKDSKVEVGPDNNKNLKSIEKQLNKAADLEKNRMLLGIIPFKLWMYNIAGDSVPDKGFRHWLKYKAGEPPVLFKNYTIEGTKQEMENILMNNGYFHHSISSEKEINKKKIKLHYQVGIEQPYVFGKITFPKIQDTITSYIAKTRDNSLVKEEEQYNLEVLKSERKRIENELKKQGFFYFLSDYLYFRLDSNSNTRIIKPALAIKDDLPPGAMKKWYLNNVVVHHDTSLQADIAMDTLISNGVYHLYKGELNIREQVISNSIFLKPDKVYSENDYRNTLRRLNSLGVFKFIQLRFSETGRGDDNKLNANITLVQQKPKSLRAEVSAVTKSNDFTGPGIDLRYVNRNVKRTASNLIFSLNSGFETQLIRRSGGLNNIELGSDIQLDVPRIVAPAFIPLPAKEAMYNPRTLVKGGFSYFNRSSLYAVNSLHLSMDYSWRITSTQSHELRIVSIDYQRMHVISDLPEVALFLERNHPEQFITGMKYTYTLNNLLQNRNFNHFINFSIEPAGNTISLIDEIFNKESTEIFGIPNTQYARIINDARLTWNISERNKMVGRLFVGMGIPYGNSDIMPFMKRFYTGGTTSLRAFQSRSVGPGTFMQTDSTTVLFQLGQTGDLKFESNLEYRIGLSKYLKGALFIDAGNVWLYNEDEQIPGGAFPGVEFLNQLAIGGGAGLRLDVSFFVLRLDLAIPFKKPYLQTGDRWVIDEINMFDKNWRQNNLVINLAFGYPF